MRLLVIVLATFALATAVRAAPAPAGQVIRHPRADSSTDARNRYFLAVLRLALDETRLKYGDYRLVPMADNVPQSRAIQLLSQGRGLDVLWTMTTKAREQELLPIRIPLLKGLMGYRIFLIRADDQPWFHSIHTLDQLRELRAGQGHDWPDTGILQANGLPVTTSDNYEGLFKMLEQGRIDYLPRAINEPWEELAAHPHMNLAVEDSLMLYYPTANYFFVNRDNQQLAKRLREGLQQAIADGSFNELFHNYPVNKRAFAHAGLLSRRILRLNNPMLPEDTPLDQSKLWWPPQQLSRPREGDLVSPAAR